MPYPKGRGKFVDKKSGREKGSIPWNKDKRYHIENPIRKKKHHSTYTN